MGRAENELGLGGRSGEWTDELLGAAAEIRQDHLWKREEWRSRQKFGMSAEHGLLGD